MATITDQRYLVRYPVEFVRAEDPADSRFVFSPRGRDQVELTANDALAILSKATRDHEAHQSTRAWANACLIALRLMTQGRLASPDQADVSQLQSAAAALPYPPKEAQDQVFSFLRSLAVNAPAAATTPQQPAWEKRPTYRKPEPVFKFFLRLEFGSGTKNLIATATLSLQEAEGPWGAVDVADLWANENHRLGGSGRRGVLRMLAAVESAWPPAARLREDIASGKVQLDADEVALLGEGRTRARLAANRLEVYWPRDLSSELVSRPVLRRIEAPGSDRPAAFGSEQMFAFDWSVALGGDILTAAELDELASSQHGLIQLRNKWVFVDPSEIARLRDRGTRTVSSEEALRAAVTGNLVVDGIRTEVDTIGWLDSLRQKLAQQDRDIAPAVQPEGLDGTLRDYQLQGLHWLAQLTELGLGGCLADDMGLGKTIMLIALHLHQGAKTGVQRPTLVVCPASVLGNWEKEIHRFAPGVPTRRFHGPGRTLEGMTDGFVLTTYGTMRADSERLAAHTPSWGLVVADEAQNVKNPRARTAQALRTIPAQACIALTGTPVENNLSELWSILDWTTPGLLGTHDEFRKSWSRPIEARRDTRRATELAQLIRPFVLRRRKSDPGIAPELPPKTETDHQVHLTREQVGLYEAVVRDALEQIKQAQGIRRRGLIVKLLTQCKQICNHPAQFLRQPTSKLTGRSGKFQIFDELVEEIIAEDGAILVFTQYVIMGRLLARHLEEKGIKHLFLHGATTVPKREVMVRQFQAGEAPVFILSLRAAGVGLNLTRADHVIHFDRWWNPAVEDQATDRAYRIGQTKPVQVHRLLSEGTIEENIAELITSKRELADAVINGGEAALTELTDSELATLVKLRRSTG